MVKAAIRFLCALVLCTTVLGSSANWWVTSLDKTMLLQQQAALTPISGTGSASTIITPVPSVKYQQMYGYGGALTESAAMKFIDMKNANLANYKTVLNNLFSTTTGAGLSVVRVPIGSSDMSISPYFTYDENYDDWLFDDFNFGRDSTYMIPVMKDILAINPAIKIIIACWTAPTWMKTSVNASNSFYWGNINPRYYDDYAFFLQTVIQKLAAEGIPVYALSMQNEPQDTVNSFPVMGVTPVDEMNIATLLGLKFKAAGITAKTFVYDHNWDTASYPISVLSNSTSNQYLAGTAFHCYGGGVSNQTVVHNAFPNKEIWFTECAGEGASNFAGNIPWNVNNLYIGAVQNWASTVLHWNLATDTSYGPKASGGCAQCRGFITVQSDNVDVVYNEEYYGTAMYNKFMKFPTYRTESTLVGGFNCVTAISFINNDGTSLISIFNNCQTPQPTVVQGSSSYLSLTVPVGLSSVVWTL